MEPERTPNQLPPVIRVFLSSTFADMEKERSYFNEVLVPRLNRVCAQRGVSFFSVDLRWGITEEDQVNGQVLPICLSEIDKCRPFFIGILGNRYGSVMESVPSQIVDSIPWLTGKEGCSITELEMLYAVLDQQRNSTVKNCAFYMRSDKLSEAWYGPSEESPRLTALKDRIRSDANLSSTEYGDLEEFGRVVEADILHWLDQEFPVPEKVNEVRRSWYNRELLRGYIDIPRLHSFLDSYFGESDRSLLFYGNGAKGKTTFLTAWQPRDGKKVLINCGSDDAFLYWPSIARQIINELAAIDSRCGTPKIKTGASVMFRLLQTAQDETNTGQPQRLSTDFYFVTDEEKEDFRTAFLAWLETLPLQEPVYIVINDLNLLEDESSHMLSWLPSSACGKVRFLCSTNSEEMVSNAENLGWNCTQMPDFPLESAGIFIRNYLHIYGKSLAEEQLQALLRSAVAVYPGQLRFIADFLINNGRFENLSTLIGDLAGQAQLQGIYRYIYDFSVQALTDRERKAVATVFALLRCARMSLNEPECFRLAEVHSGVTAMEWARIRSVFEEFKLIQGDYWNMQEEELQKFTDSILSPQELSAIEELLGDDMLRQLHASDHHRSSLRSIRECTAFSKAALHHYQQCRHWDKLHTTLTDPGVLYYLSKLDWQAVRVAWVHLILYSDIDIPASLFALLDKYRDRQGDDRQIAMYVAGLYKDLELRTHLDRVYGLMGTNRISGSLNSDLNRVSDAFISLYKPLHELKSNRQFKQLYAQVKHYLSSGASFSPVERCQLLFFKADAEGHIQLLKEFLDTSNAYYAEAILASSVYDMRRALSLRGDALYRLGQYSDAAATQRQVSRLAFRDGDLRSYLASRNILAMCLYREEKYTESVAEYDILYHYWKKLGDIREAGNTLLNKSNALALSGDYRAALETAEDALTRLPAEQETLASLRCALLSNMGIYALKLKLYDEAERYLTQSITDAEAAGQEHTAIRSRSSLIEIYKQTDRFMKAVEQYTAQLELLWQRQEYALLTDALRKAVDLLLCNKYASMAKDLQTRWEKRFSQIEGGKEFFHKQVDAGISDSHLIAQKKEQLALARSEGSTEKMARACYELACAMLSADQGQALDILLEAASLCRQCGQDTQSGKYLEEALVLLFEKGVPKDQALFRRIMAQTKDPAVCRITSIWEQLGTVRSLQTAAEEQKFSFFKKMKPHSAASVPELLVELVRYAENYENLVLRCLVDTVEQMIDHCTAQQIIHLVQALHDSAAEVLSYRIDKAMLRNFHEDIAALTREYSSPAASEKLTYYEKCLEVLDALGSTNAPAIAGNLALIYRRREDPEKTIRYHTISTEAYKKQGKLRDYFIELMNTATAYNQFGQTDQAVTLLRRGMEETAAAGEKGLEASMAGNLASFLSRTGDPGDHEEILRCFSIEEQYFRYSGSSRDLVISLMNQIIYLHKNTDYAGWKDKLEEAGKLIRSNRFREFEKALAQLEWLAENSARTGGGSPNGDQA